MAAGRNRVGIDVGVNDKASGPLAKIRDRFDQLGKSKGAQSVLQGLGMGSGISAWNLLSKGISKVVDVMGDSITSAIAEEKSIAGLNAALKANIVGWDGNTDAMEKVLASRMRLGHSDDEQRESLKLIVAATGDVTKALDVQRVAMDLAALKGISLQAASEALVKVEAGQFRILKTLGIQLPKNATATQALAAVQKVAAGSAEALAETTGGKMLSSQVRIGEALEKVGEKALPLVVVGMETAADAVEGLTGAIDILNGKLPETEDEFRDTSISLARFVAALPLPGVGIMSKALENDLTPALDDVGRAAQLMGGDVGGASKVVDKAGDVAEDTADDFDDLATAITKSGDAMLESIFGPVELKGKLAELEGQYRETKTELKKLEAIKNPTLSQREDIVETRGELAETKAEIIRTKIQLGLLDKASLQDAIDEVAALKGGTAAAKREAHLLYLELVRLNGGDFNTKNTGGGGMGGTRHSGGPVEKGVPYIVGKKGAEELFIPDQSGRIATGSMSGAAVGGSGAVVVNFNSIWPPTPAQAREIARVLQDVTDFDRTLATFAPGA